MNDKPNILKYLELIAEIIPVAIYWFDVDQKFLGVNKFVIEGTGSTSYEKDFYNKTPYDLYPKKMADIIVQHHKKAIQTQKTVVGEEEVKTDKKLGSKYLEAYISPLYDDDRKIIGTVGISIDISTKKMSEEIEFEEKTLKKSKKLIEKLELSMDAPLQHIKKEADHTVKSLLADATNVVDPKKIIEVFEGISHEIVSINNNIKGIMFDLNENLKRLDYKKRNI